jgi:tetratricopeptide (TPR) repeat protein
MAVQLNSNYSKAYTGLALVNILTGKFETATDNLALGLKNAQTNDEKLFVNVARIIYYTMNKTDQNWLELAKNQFNEAVIMNSKYAPAYYFMGLAYKEALEFNFANQMFTKVTELKTAHMADAEKQLKFIERYKQAKPLTQAGKQIATVEKITRADAAALFIEELKIKEIFSKMEKKASKEIDEVTTQIKETEPVLTGAVIHPPIPLLANDIADHPFKNDIEEVLKTGVRGLENDPNGNFKPGEVISRGEYAIMLEDILIKLTGEKDIPARYVNSKSLFPDVPSDMPYFKAIISVTSREIMQVKNVKTGEFAPLKPLSGLEALLTIHKLKEKLEIN